jgi:hypothetical protein
MTLYVDGPYTVGPANGREVVAEHLIGNAFGELMAVVVASPRGPRETRANATVLAASYTLAEYVRRQAANGCGEAWAILREIDGEAP